MRRDSGRSQNQWEKRMGEQHRDKIVCGSMQVRAEQVQIKITHYIA